MITICHEFVFASTFAIQLLQFRRERKRERGYELHFSLEKEMFL